MKKIFLFVLALVFFASVSAFASDNDLAYKGINELESITTSESGDLVPVYDASTDTVKKMDAANTAISGDVTFQSTLLATGRKNGSSTLSSSSTQLNPSTLPYTLIIKNVGGTGGLDETDGGTRLQDGVSGQVLVLWVVGLKDTGTWIVTPDTSYSVDTITLNTIGDMVTLLYVDDTVGWVVTANTGATVADNDTAFGWQD